MPDPVTQKLGPAAIGQFPESYPSLRRPDTAYEPGEDLPGNAGQSVELTGTAVRSAYAQFLVDAVTHRIQIRIIDPVTEEIIREIPSEAVERMIQELRKYEEALARARRGPFPRDTSP